MWLSPSFSHTVSKNSRVVHVETAAGVDQMLILVRERSRRVVHDVGLLALVAKLREGVRHEHVEDLAEVAAGAALETELGVGRRREEIALEEEAADEAVAPSRRELVHFFREEDDDLAVLIDVRRRAEGVHVERVDQRIESRRERRCSPPS